MTTPAAGSTNPLEFNQVLYEELAALMPRRFSGAPCAPSEAELYKEIHALATDAQQPRPLAALCLSGGGIRSATFSLGVVQALARAGVLTDFDYLSTVSGGGYIGSWMTAWIKRKADANPAEDPYERVAAELAGARLDPGADGRVVPEAPAIAQLREFSHYLAPRSGALSADFWSLVATVLRNIILNWFVLIPILLAALALPRLFAALILAGEPTRWASWTLIGIGFGTCAWSIGYSSYQRVLALKPVVRRANERKILMLGVLPVWIAALALSAGWAWLHLRTADDTLQSLRATLPGFVVFGALVMLVGWTGYALIATTIRRASVDPQLMPRGFEWVFEPATFVFAGIVGGTILRVAAHPFDESVLTPSAFDLLAYTTVAPPLFVLSFTLAATIFVGLASKVMDEFDREWLSRFGAWALLSATGWTALSVVVLLLPFWVAEGIRFWIATAVTATSGAITIIGGFSRKTVAAARAVASAGAKWTPAQDGNRPVSLALKIALPIFVVLFAIGLSLVTDCLVAVWTWLATTEGFEVRRFIRAFPEGHVQFSGSAVNVGIAIGSAVLGALASLLIGINKFSLHAMYRNRLIRAFLGASRGRSGVSAGRARHPDPFIGFDPDDDVALCDSAPSGAPRRRLLHVINMALNIVSGEQLAWQERKAESMTATSLHVGTYWLGYRRSSAFASRRSPVDREPHPFTLGTAMAISGAAASPNMGYHSSPVVTFLMTLFNARLGWWLGNPGVAGARMHTYQLESPRSSLRPLFAEAFGWTDESHPYIYASDGGHFENLGLYEMVRRRCRVVVVVDAGADPQVGFEDLSGAIRKIRSDMGISIDVPDEPARRIYARSPERPAKDAGKMMFIGRIRYSDVDAPRDAAHRVSPDDRDRYDGALLYIKPTYYGRDEPLDVTNYAAAHTAFPHEPTTDQFFSESQFESYRALGFFAGSLATATMDRHTGSRWEQLISSVADYVEA